MSTATTPGIPTASDTSIDSTTACAIVERTNVHDQRTVEPVLGRSAM